MKITFDIHYELVKEVAYNLESNEPSLEYIYVVDAEWLNEYYYTHFIKMFGYEGYTLDNFLDIYDPDIEGIAIYYIAKGQGKIIEEGWAEVAENY